MYDHILVPLDRSTTAEAALDAASAVAGPGPARVTILTVVDADPSMSGATDPGAEWLDQARHYLQGLAKRLQPHNFPVEEAIQTGRPADRILAVAAEQEIDLIVMTTHGAHTDLAFPMGSTAWKVLTRSTIPVLLVRTSTERSASRLLADAGMA